MGEEAGGVVDTVCSTGSYRGRGEGLRCDVVWTSQCWKELSA